MFARPAAMSVFAKPAAAAACRFQMGVSQQQQRCYATEEEEEEELEFLINQPIGKLEEFVCDPERMRGGSPLDSAFYTPAWKVQDGTGKIPEIWRVSAAGRQYVNRRIGWVNPASSTVKIDKGHEFSSPGTTNEN